MPEDGAILIDAGTSTRRFAEALPADRESTVVVNSPELATFIARRANITVMMPGGRVRSRTLAVVDDWALTILCQIHVDVVFMGTNGVSIEREAGDARRPDHRTPDECRQLVERALAAKNAAQARDVVLNA